MRTIAGGRVLFLAAVLFLWVGGGTALASYVVSSNGQIGPNTVSGHHPPAGMHANIVSGSVNATDLAPAAVTSAKLGSNSVTGAKVKNGSLSAPDLAPTVRLPQRCAVGQIPKRSGAVGWSCGTTKPTGGAGGALAGTYPNPILNVSGGPCANGEALTDVSAQAALTCKPGVYSDANNNVAAAPNAFGALTTGFANSALGNGALGADTEGNGNAASGYEALAINTTGNLNTASGFQALKANTTGSHNTASGNSALADNTTGTDNAASGDSALGSNTTGIQNTASGSSALGSNTTGTQNMASGYRALTANTTGSFNMASGDLALANNTTGDDSTASGADALLDNTTGIANTATGAGALLHNTIGFANTASGGEALSLNTSGNGNAVLGYEALHNTTGDNNTALGHSAGFNLTTGSNNIDIANDGVAGESNTIRIGNQGTENKTFLAGVSGVSTGGAASPVLVDSNGQLGTTSSSRRFKRDIRPIGGQREGLMALKPVSFRYKRSFVHGQTPPQFGLIAEQVARVYPNLVVYGHDGKPSAVAYQELPALELAQLRHEHAALRRQRSRNQVQSRKMRSQGKQIAALQGAVLRLSAQN